MISEGGQVAVNISLNSLTLLKINGGYQSIVKNARYFDGSEVLRSTVLDIQYSILIKVHQDVT